VIQRPRFYAANILTLSSREERVECLNKVPEKWRSWVELIVRNEYERRKHAKRA
jgi:hypothetical protein